MFIVAGKDEFRELTVQPSMTLFSGKWRMFVPRLLRGVIKVAEVTELWLRLGTGCLVCPHAKSQGAKTGLLSWSPNISSKSKEEIQNKVSPLLPTMRGDATCDRSGPTPSYLLALLCLGTDSATPWDGPWEQRSP